jgi:hypothetical protein
MDPPDRDISDPAANMAPEVSIEFTHKDLTGSHGHLAHYQSRRMDVPALHPCFNPRRQHL